MILCDPSTGFVFYESIVFQTYEQDFVVKQSSVLWDYWWETVIHTLLTRGYHCVISEIKMGDICRYMKHEPQSA